jgi:hypothetical protein
MSVNLEQADGAEENDAGMIEPPPQPFKPKEASSPTAAAVPHLSSSRRVKFNIGLESLDALPGSMSWSIGKLNRE